MRKFLIILLIIFGYIPVNSQCAMCKAVVENGDSNMAEGLNFGIIYLMIFPYLILTVGIILYLRNRKKRKNTKITD